MYQKISLVLKGFVIGLGKVIPGVSGSLIAVSFGLYEKCIESISNFFCDIKKNIIFLGSLGIGIILAVVFGSRIILWTLQNFYTPTMFLFIGLIAGGIPSLLKKSEKKSTADFFLIALGFAIMIIIDLCSTTSNFHPTDHFSDLIVISGLGFLDAVTMIAPGISGTAIFILLGCYSFILDLFSHLFIIDYIWFMIFFAIGLLIGIIIVSNIMNYLLKKYRNQVYMMITGLSLSSLYMLAKEVLSNTNNLSEIILGMILSIFGYKMIKVDLS